MDTRETFLISSTFPSLSFYKNLHCVHQQRATSLHVKFNFQLFVYLHKTVNISQNLFIVNFNFFAIYFIFNNNKRSRCKTVANCRRSHSCLLAGKQEQWQDLFLTRIWDIQSKQNILQTTNITIFLLAF